ncbi:MAG: hypothetical protein IJW51_01680 [Clostridia bacterium]|nr:hypothetical protein [Clostridia bacterium]
MIKEAIEAICQAEEQAELLCRVAAERAAEMRAETEREGTALCDKVADNAKRECDFELSVVTAKAQRINARKKKEIEAETAAMAERARTHMQAAVAKIVWGIVEKCQ